MFAVVVCESLLRESGKTVMKMVDVLDFFRRFVCVALS